jgi:hypothetical protein
MIFDADHSEVTPGGNNLLHFCPPGSARSAVRFKLSFGPLLTSLAWAASWVGRRRPASQSTVTENRYFTNARVAKWEERCAREQLIAVAMLCVCIHGGKNTLRVTRYTGAYTCHVAK